MYSSEINGEGELRGQLANPGSPGKMTVKTECVCVCSHCVTNGLIDGHMPINSFPSHLSGLIYIVVRQMYGQKNTHTQTHIHTLSQDWTRR